MRDALLFAALASGLLWLGLASADAHFVGRPNPRPRPPALDTSARPPHWYRRMVATGGRG